MLRRKFFPPKSPKNYISCESCRNLLPVAFILGRQSDGGDIQLVESAKISGSFLQREIVNFQSVSGWCL